MFERFNLKDSAFPVTPTGQLDLKWFGFPALKVEFENIMRRSASESLRLCVLNRGRLGAGKTHAARYFTGQSETEYANGVYEKFVSVVIESPKQGQKAFLDFATRLLNAVTFREISRVAQNLRTLRGADQLFADLLQITGLEDVATVLSKIDEDNLLTCTAFLVGGGTARELREVGVAKRISTENEFASALAGVMHLLINGQSGQRSTRSRMLLWVDEMEDLVYFPTRYYLPFTQGLREVIDKLSEHFTLMLNFTFSEPDDLPAIESILGQAIMQRVNRHIVFSEPSLDDLRQYLLDLFKANRLRPQRTLDAFPFSVAAFELLLQSAESKTPRFLNKLCDLVLRNLEDLKDNRLGLTSAGIPAEILSERLPVIVTLLEEERA